MPDAVPAFPTAADLLACGADDVLAGAGDSDYFTLQTSLGEAAAEARAADALPRAAALQLLAHVCGMLLDPDDRAAPYKAGFVSFVDGRRSMIPEDLDGLTLLGLAELAPTLAHPLLRARLADLAWEHLRPRAVPCLQLALESYRAAIGAPSLARWHDGQATLIVRVLQLATAARGAGDAVRDALEHPLLASFDAAPDASEAPVFWLTEPLLRFGLAKERAAGIAGRLERIAEGLRGGGDPTQARGYFTIAERWYRVAGDQDAAFRALGTLARCFEEDGDAHEARMVAMNLYDNALQLWRDMPRRRRLALEGEARIDALRTKLAEAGRAVVDEELHAVQTPPVDITDLVRMTREGIAGLPPLDALAAFAGLHRGADVAALRTAAQEGRHPSIFSQLFGTIMMSADGRPVAKTPAAGTGDPEDDLAHTMVQDLLLEAQLVAEASILPALEVLRYEHTLRRADFEALACESAIVPRDRASLVGKGLHAGYQGDFVAALHVLAPQLEHMVRYHLKRAGAHTTTLDDGVVTEKGLSSLVKMPEMVQVFKEDLQFEIAALFCSSHGPNFRNEIAHGLVLEPQLAGPRGVYAWWLVFRLVFNVFWNRRRPSPEAEPLDDTPPSVDPSQTTASTNEEGGR